MAHGVSVNEVPTGVVPAVRVTAGLPVYVGTAPINAGDLTFVNKVAVVYTLAEAVAKVGPITSDFDKWTLHEPVKAHFSDYSVGPIVLINVLDPTKSAHKATATDAAHIVGTDGTVELQAYGAPDEAVVGIIKSTVVIKKGGVTKTLNTDYTLIVTIDFTGANNIIATLNDVERINTALTDGTGPVSSTDSNTVRLGHSTGTLVSGRQVVAAKLADAAAKTMLKGWLEETAL